MDLSWLDGAEDSDGKLSVLDRERRARAVNASADRVETGQNESITSGGAHRERQRRLLEGLAIGDAGVRVPEDHEESTAASASARACTPQVGAS